MTSELPNLDNAVAQAKALGAQYRAVLQVVDVLTSISNLRAEEASAKHDAELTEQARVRCVGALDVAAEELHNAQVELQVVRHQADAEEKRARTIAASITADADTKARAIVASAEADAQALRDLVERNTAKHRQMLAHWHKEEQDAADKLAAVKAELAAVRKRLGMEEDKPNV